MIERKKIRSAGILLTFLLMMYVSVSARQPEVAGADTTTTFDFTLFIPSDPFIADTPLVINLEFDIKQFTRTRKEGEYMDAKLSYTDYAGTVTEKDVQIRARGDFRREHCSIPPIKLNLMNDTTGDESLSDIKSVKLVTHCRESGTYEQYLLKEYLIYRMYNLLTEYSYCVRLLMINYIDSQGEVKTHTRYGFVIESDKHLAVRINAAEIEMLNLSCKMTDYELFHLLAVFQFMIGNADWAVPALHNIKLFKILSITKEYPVAVPYDFDYTGMVNAYYAIPDEKLGIKSVRERIYRGYCIPEEDYIPVFRKFNENKDQLYNLVSANNLLDHNNKEEMTAYLDEFFHILANQRLRETLIIKSCREL